MKKIASIVWLGLIVLAALFVFSYTPTQPIWGPAMAPEVPVMVPEQEGPQILPTPTQPVWGPEAPEVPVQVPGVTMVPEGTQPVVVAPPRLVVTNQAQIDSAQSNALYVQTLTGLLLILGSAFLIFARKYEDPSAPRVGAMLLGMVAVILAAVMVIFDLIPSETLPPAFALVAIMVVAAGPVLQLMAPDQKVLDELGEVREDLDASENELDVSEKELEKLQGGNKALAKELKSSRAEATAANNKIAGAEKAATEAVDRAGVAEQSVAEAEVARHAAETARAVAEAEVGTLRDRTEVAEVHSADVQVRLNAFEERKTADVAVTVLASAQTALVATEQRVTGLRSDLQVAEAEQARLALARIDADESAEGAWVAVNEAAENVLTAETTLLDARKAADAASEAVAKGVKILDTNGLQQALSNAEAEYAKATDALSRLNAEARVADVKVGCLATEVQHADTMVFDLSANLETSQGNFETAKISVEEATKIAEAAEVEAVAAERRFTALVAAEQQSAELSTQLATEQAENATLIAQNDELKVAVKDALRASGCTLSLVRVQADEDVAEYRVDLVLPQGHEISFAVHIMDDEGEETLFRTIPAGRTKSEIFGIDRGYNTKIKVLSPQVTAQELGVDQVAAYLVA